MNQIKIASAKATIQQGGYVAIYSLPSTATHAFVDINLFKLGTGQSKFSVAISKKTNPAQITSAESPYDDTVLHGYSNDGEIAKTLIGTGEILYVRVVQGDNVNVRVTAMEHSSSKIAKAGTLAATVVTSTAIEKIYELSTVDAAYASISYTVYNPNSTEALVEIWQGTGATPVSGDQVSSIIIPTTETLNAVNICLQPGEKLWVKSTLPNMEWNVNGFVARM